MMLSKMCCLPVKMAMNPAEVFRNCGAPRRWLASLPLNPPRVLEALEERQSEL